MRHKNRLNIDCTVNKEKFSEIKLLYTHYVKKFWSYKQAHKYFKRLNLTANISSTCLVVTDTIVGGVTFNQGLFRALVYCLKH